MFTGLMREDFYWRRGMMSSNDKLWNQLVASFSPGDSGANGGTGRGVGSGAQRKLKEKQGFDPYNSSGTFDRKKNWNRVGKR